MRHGVKKTKFKKGQDHNQAMTRKLLRGFFIHGKLETTYARARDTKGRIDKLVHKAQRANTADINVLNRLLNDKTIVDYLVKEVAPLFKKRVSGFVSIKKLGPRQGDHAEMGMLRWVKDIPPLRKDERGKNKEVKDKGDKQKK